MQTQTSIAADIKHAKSVPMEFIELQQIAKQRFSGFEHWLVIFDNDSKQFIDRIARRFYKGADEDDFGVYITLWQGRLFGTACLRKRCMLINSLRRELSRYAINLTKKQMEARDLLIVTAPKNLLHGTCLAEKLLGNPNGPKAPAPLPYDGHWPANHASMN